MTVDQACLSTDPGVRRHRNAVEDNRVAVPNCCTSRARARPDSGSQATRTERDQTCHAKFGAATVASGSATQSTNAVEYGEGVYPPIPAGLNREFIAQSKFEQPTHPPSGHPIRTAGEVKPRLREPQLPAPSSRHSLVLLEYPPFHRSQISVRLSTHE